MVHTATITYVYADSAIYKAFREHPGSQYYPEKHRWFNNTFENNGLVFSCTAIGKKGFVMNTLSCRINFAKMLGKENPLDVMCASDFISVHEKFYDLMQDFIPDISDLREWYANRVDYCVNVNVGTSKEVKEYIRLLQMSNIPHFMRKQRQPNGNYQFLPGSYYVVSKARRSKRTTGSCTINFYDKQDQLLAEQKNGRNDITDDLLKRANGLLRLEVQCNKPKINYIKKKKGFDTTSISYFLTENTALEILEDAVLRISKSADFWKKNTALQMVDQAEKLTKNMKEKLKKLINDVAVSSIPVVREKYLADGISKETFANYLILLEKHNINVCTIPREHKIQHLDSIYTLLQRGLMEEDHA